MTSIIPFAFEDSLVRTVVKDGEPWFVGADVCRILEIRDHRQALEKLDDDERGRCSVPTPGGVQEVIAISEPGLYRLIFRSSKPVAERLKRWLAHDVLPSLRKTGSYQGDRAANLKAEMARLNATSRAMREIRLTLGPIEAARAAPALLAKIGVHVVAENAGASRQGEFSFNASA